MNRQRRNRLASVVLELTKYIEDEIENGNTIDSAVSELEDLRDEEQESYDNLPDSLQETDRAELWLENIDYFDNAIDCLNNAMDLVDDEESDKDDVKESVQEALDELESIE